MSFQLSIKHHLEEADHFAAARVETYESGRIRIGRDTACDCQIDSEDFAPEHMVLEQAKHGHRWSLVPQPGCDIYLNHEPVAGPVRLHSGDEIRVNHWTIRFQMVYAAASHARKADVMATVAKILVALILIAELFIVIWLPQRIRAASLWEKDIAQQRTIMLLDQLRKDVREPVKGNALNPAALEVIQAELNRLTRYVRAHEADLSRSQWRQIHDDLIRYAQIVAQIQDGTAFPGSPQLDVPSGVAGILQKNQK